MRTRNQFQLKIRESLLERSEKRSFFDRITHVTEQFWQSAFYFPILFLLAAFVMLDQTNPGIPVFACLLCWFLFFSTDLMAAILPFLLLCLMTVDSFDNFRQLLKYVYLIPLIGGSFVYHLWAYAKPFRVGRNYLPHLLVTAATLLGGLGTISMRQATSPVSLYYSLGLGGGMLAVYFVAKTQLTADRGYRPAEKLGSILYTAGMFAGFLVLRFYGMHLENFIKTLSTEFISYRNYLSTVLLMGLPVPFYKSLHKSSHLLAAGFMYICLMMTGSRSGVIFGTMLMVTGLLYILHYDLHRRKKYLTLLGLLAVPMLALNAALLVSLFASRMADGTFMVKADDSRIRFLLQSVKDFKANPLFGLGLGNVKNSSIYQGVPGSMIWYHNWAAQIIGCMGLTGVIAYGMQVKRRLATIRAAWNPLTAVLAMSYAGVFLMSMTNPGEFCPLPNEFMVVILFALLEEEEKSHYKVHTAQEIASALPSAYYGRNKRKI